MRYIILYIYIRYGLHHILIIYSMYAHVCHVPHDLFIHLLHQFHLVWLKSYPPNELNQLDMTGRQ